MTGQTQLSLLNGPPWASLLERLEAQLWLAPALYVVATPIGNLTDLTLRAWYTLRLVDVIAAEDTRSTRVLLQAWGLSTPLIAAHRHNEREVQESIIGRLSEGQRVALVSDAGAPAISDPGGYLVQNVRAAGYPVIPLPGPSAVITALMAIGATTDADPAFTFLGFLPPKQAARVRTLEPWVYFAGTLVLYEAPHRLKALLTDLSTVFGDQRVVSLARELTKRFEQTVTLSLGEAQAWLAADAHREQGEYVVMVHPPEKKPDLAAQDDAWHSPERLTWMDALLAHVSTRDAARIMAQALNEPRDLCYAKLLARSGQ
jgi:16S rRNA (cytidine1402-2'-O)-methyltransferase